MPRKLSQLPTPNSPTPKDRKLGVGSWVLGIGIWRLGVITLLLALLAVPLLAAQLAPTGTLRATFIANNPVQGRVDSSGATSGPAPDLARELARRLKVPHAITPLPS